jgi:chromosome segregation ATPase
MVSIATFLQPARRASADHVDELAARIAAGAAVQPEEVLAVLDRCGCSEDDLQAAVDRAGRVLDLRRQLAGAGPVEKRLAEIEAEVKAADAEVQAAREKLRAIIGRVNEEHLDLRVKADAIDRARRSLMAEENLPPAVADRLRAARAASERASDALTARQHELDERRSRLRRAKEDLPIAEREASMRPASVDARDNVERLRNAVKARGDLVVEAEKSLVEAEKQFAQASEAVAAVEREVAATVFAPPKGK